MGNVIDLNGFRRDKALNQPLRFDFLEDIDLGDFAGLDRPHGKGIAQIRELSRALGIDFKLVHCSEFSQERNMKRGIKDWMLILQSKKGEPYLIEKNIFGLSTHIIYFCNRIQLGMFKTIPVGYQVLGDGTDASVRRFFQLEEQIKRYSKCRG